MIKKLKELIEKITAKIETRGSFPLQRWVMWNKGWKKARYLRQNGWMQHHCGRWASPKITDLKRYTLDEAIKEEKFYWLTT